MPIPSHVRGRSIDELSKLVWDWLVANKLTHDTHIYSHKEWNVDRGEDYGESAVFVITSEGELYNVINGHYGPGGWEIEEQFRKFLKSLGLWYEPGHAWSYSIYPLDEEEEAGVGPGWAMKDDLDGISGSLPAWIRRRP
jgi:hypothetical protein